MAKDLREAAPCSCAERKLRPRGKGEICPRFPQEGGAEQGLERASYGVPSTPNRHGVPLPVPVHATAAQGGEQCPSGEDQDENQDPHG